IILGGIKMKDKKRLEEIKERVLVDKVYYKYLDGTKGHWGKTYTLNEEDYKHLIQQAEQVEEFGKELTRWQDLHKEDTIGLDEQNKRYREAMKEAKEMASCCGMTAVSILEEALEDSK